MKKRGNKCDVMDLTFGCKITDKMTLLHDKNVIAYYHSTHWAERKGQKHNIQNIKPEKMQKITCIIGCELQVFWGDDTLSENSEF